MRKTKETNKGITLIALIITIIVMLVLVAVTISMAVNGGLFEYAGKAAGETENARDKEQELGNLESNMTVQELIDKYTTDTSGGITASQIAKKPIEYYGKVVTGYTYTNNDAVEAWKIFYADEENIYLIASDYIHLDYVPGKDDIFITNENAIEKNYVIRFSNLEDYKGSESIINPNVRKWLGFLNSYGQSTETNMKKVATMLDTDLWSSYKGEDAEYAIAGPTLDLYVASYKQTHPNKTIEYEAQTYGYVLRYKGDESFTPTLKMTELSEDEDLYVISSTEKTNAMWIASPSHGDADYDRQVLYVKSSDDNSKWISHPTYMAYDGGSPGFRPVVCLKKGVELEKLADGKTYKIK